MKVSMVNFEKLTTVSCESMGFNNLKKNCKRFIESVRHLIIKFMFYYLNYVERKMALKTHVVITGENLLIFSLGRFSNSSREAGNAIEKTQKSRCK